MPGERVVGDAWVAIRPLTSGFGTALSGELSGPLKNAEGMFGKLGKAGAAAVAGIGAAAVGIGAVAVDMAAKFQTSTLQLVTGAGESQKAIGMVRAGLLQMAGDVGTSATDLSKGLYLIESAGFHGAAGLQLLRIAAEGAKVGGADLATVSDALTSALNAYHQPASRAVSVTNDLIATVAAGKLHMEDLAASLGKILPTASSLGISLPQVTAAIATMTVQGTDAATATTGLRFIMASLAGPTSIAAKSLEAMGIGADKIKGFTAAAGVELGKLQIHTSDVAATLAGPGGLPAALDMITAALAKQFPQYQTNAGQRAEFDAGLKAVVGGTRGFTAALELTGPSAKTYADNIAKITAAYDSNGKAVTGWALVQQTFGEKVDEVKAKIGAWLIQLGTALLPMLSQLADWISTKVMPQLDRFGNWIVTVGLPKVAQFGQWVGANIAAPLAHVASFVIPPLLSALKLVVDHIDDIKTPALILGATLAGIWAVNKIKTWSETAISAISKVLGVGAGSSPVSALTAAAGVQKVFVTNWEMIGNKGGFPTPPGFPTPTPAGVPPAAEPGIFTTLTKLPVIGTIIAGIATDLEVGKGWVDAANQHWADYSKSVGLTKNQILTLSTFYMTAPKAQIDAVQKATAGWQAQGLSVQEIAHRVWDMEQSFTAAAKAAAATAAAAQKIHFSAQGAADIYWAFKGNLFGMTTRVKDDFLAQGLNSKQATTGTSEIAQLWKTHKITTGGQMQLAVQNYIAMTLASGGIPPTLNQLEGVLAGSQPDAHKFAGKVGLLPGAAQNLIDSFNNAAGIMVNINSLILSGSSTAAGELAKIRQQAMSGTGGRAEGGDAPPGWSGWVGEKGPEWMSVTSRGAHVTSNAQSKGMSGPSIHQTLQFYGVEDTRAIEAAIARNNRTLIRHLAAAR